MNDEKVTVGRVVHYVSYGTPGGEYPSLCRAAVVTEVVGETLVGLCVLNPTGQFFNRDVEHDPGEKDEHGDITGLCDGLRHHGGTWHWPART